MNMSHEFHFRIILWPFCEICKTSMYVYRSISTFCNKSVRPKSSCGICVDNRKFCTFCNISFAYLMMSWALSSSAGSHEITVFDAGGFGNQKQHDLFLQQLSECVGVCRLFIMFTSFSLSHMPLGIMAVIYLSMNLQTSSYECWLILVHRSPIVSNRHVVNPSSETLFWSHSLLCDQEDVHHSISIVRRVTQVYVETYIHQ